MMDAAMIGTVIGGILGGAGTTWGVLERFRRVHAETNAGIARENGIETLFSSMTTRLESLEKDVSGLRLELAQERSHSRALERHIWRLERLMRQGGMDPPAFEDPVQAMPG